MKTKIALALLLAWSFASLAAACGGSTPAAIYVEPAPVTVTPAPPAAPIPAPVVVVELPDQAPVPAKITVLEAGAPSPKRRKLGATVAPGQTPVQTCDPGGVYCASVTDGGALVTTATLTGTVSVGAVTVNNDASLPVPVTGTVGTTIPATFATPSQWYDASAGTIKEAGAIVYSLSCSNANPYAVHIQIYQSTSPPVADATAYIDLVTIPSFGGAILGQDFFTSAGLSIPTAFSWGASQITHYYSAAGVAGITCTWLFQ